MHRLLTKLVDGRQVKRSSSMKERRRADEDPYTIHNYFVNALAAHAGVIVAHHTGEDIANRLQLMGPVLHEYAQVGPSFDLNDLAADSEGNKSCQRFFSLKIEICSVPFGSGSSVIKIYSVCRAKHILDPQNWSNADQPSPDMVLQGPVQDSFKPNRSMRSQIETRQLRWSKT